MRLDILMLPLQGGAACRGQAFTGSQGGHPGRRQAGGGQPPGASYVHMCLCTSHCGSMSHVCSTQPCMWPAAVCEAWHMLQAAPLHSLLAYTVSACVVLQAILKAVQTYVTELRSGVPAQHSSSGTEPAAEPGAQAGAAAAVAAATAPSSSGTSSKPAAPAAKSKSRCTVKLSEKFYARAGDIYECFVVQGRVAAFTRSPAVVEPQPGGSFSWFNGHVQVQMGLPRLFLCGVHHDGAGGSLLHRSSQSHRVLSQPGMRCLEDIHCGVRALVCTHNTIPKKASWKQALWMLLAQLAACCAAGG
jgi:hypothetical protein